ncbi:MAG TPA: hypothetical protein VKN35_09825 [Xanthomonadales bacterium]|nr:hypothetical protein [Xanthomonadales bacterium]
MGQQPTLEIGNRTDDANNLRIQHSVLILGTGIDVLFELEDFGVLPKRACVED